MKNTEFFKLSTDDFLNAFEDSWMAERMSENCDDDMTTGEREAEADALAGIYWWTCVPGCMPDSDAFGPFATLEAAQEDCLENS
jgi:hypothetical protein